ncbi:MAG: sugar phosphorylase [Chloroflexi bacterium]|nr:sugar phosphorylase [Chloroflexota bacterium]
MATAAEAARARMRERLRFLYGADIGDRTFATLGRLLDQTPPKPRTRPPEDRFDERDVVLIIYGDSLLADDLPPLAALRRFAERHLSGLVSTIHILPFSPYSSDYGFSVIDYEQVRPELGGWDDVSALGRRFGLMFDLVLNHVSAHSPWFQAFLRGAAPYDDFFITVDPALDVSEVTRPRTTPLLTQVETVSGLCHVWTTFGPDQVDLNYASPAVLLRMIEVLLGYVERGASLVRMDAVGYLWKEIGTNCIHLRPTHEVVKLFRDVLDVVAPDVAIVTETNVPHSDNISYFGNGHDEAQMVYQFPLAPLVLHALASGDARRLSAWASGLEPPSAETTFFNFEASHDGIGVVPAKGYLSDDDVRGLAARVEAHGGAVSYKTNPDGSESPYELNATLFDALSDPHDRSEPWETKCGRFLCSQAIMLALAGVPGIYLHSLFGSHNDRAGFERSGWKRDLNHEQLRLADVERRLADPSSEAARVFAGYVTLLRARRTHPAFHPNAPQAILALGPSVFGLRRGPQNGEVVVALHNVSGAPASVDPTPLGLPTRAPWHDLLADEQVVADRQLILEPYAVRWLATRA